MATKTMFENFSNSTQTSQHFVDNLQEGLPRKSLRTLQLSALSDNRLVGKGGTKDENGKNSKLRLSTERVKVYEDSTNTVVSDNHFEDHGTQTEEVCLEEMTEADRSALEFMGEDTPPDSFWQVLAEERRLALNDTLEENEQLHQELDSLKEENEKLTEIATKAEYLSSFLESVVSSTSDGSHSDDDDDAYKTGDEGKSSDDETNGNIHELADADLIKIDNTHREESPKPVDGKDSPNNECSHSCDKDVKGDDAEQRFSGEWVNVELDNDKVASTEIIKGSALD